ncbi:MULTISPECIES: 1-(5-phosphoribosyl)-5-[(5-phosphoribosylamino)methylideneamino]imidazole-4-carboxamide isomerase [unclassified Archaeoglobus]|mgnify:CR=1 FL=1|jgi:phosphoribosylformimino-5-aminoimidazole carboxamide ribotide isomerase|uniref:1-(5-phosphoribosyl)-5-[(5- phosphoribosylamino)methylideneamino]imidazole-4- carboxamide isomerase n=1 Tax=unclassified Archaeoglobus TaxID=2643606 RepID=UPI0025BDD22D|nr:MULTISPECIES: 1-(5-phosphoribosyl)-5-[(5-phosphoribosylamino)methylideneamino]imidazole-4-carboxamide isomerase [unclassified Archaeoglobus]
MFRVIPAVDLKDGKAVRLRQGREDEVTFEAEDPVEIARRWVEKGARVLHVIDLSGAFQGRLRHEDIIAKIAKMAEVQVGGGVRDFDVAERLFNLGVDRVIFGTLAVKRVEELRKFAEKWEGKVTVAIDSKKGKVAVKGWKETVELTPIQLAKLYDDLNVSFLYTNIDVEGLVSGIDREKIIEIVKSLRNPVYVAGGITSVEDIRFIKRAGAAGVVIGSALYTKKLKFEEAIKVEYEKV